MRLTIDTDANEVVQENGGERTRYALYSREGFEVISHCWLKVGWNQKYTYTFAWMGRPVIQLPEDMIRIQEVVYRIKPDVIIETGMAHGGSLVFYASLCEAMRRGRVIGIDVEIRPHNRKAIESHELFPRITLLEGDSVAAETVGRVRSLVRPGEAVLVILDSCHTKGHVLAELEAYYDLVSPGSYIVAADGITRELSDVPRGRAEWAWNNPSAAAIEFAQTHPQFELEQPAWPFNESDLTQNVTHWLGAWLRRK
jgi:cephalosporin hydroxylase